MSTAPGGLELQNDLFCATLCTESHVLHPAKVPNVPSCRYDPEELYTGLR